MENFLENKKENKKYNYLGNITLKFLSINAILFVLFFVNPKSTNNSILYIFLSSIIIVTLDFLISSFIGIFDMPFGRMLTSFLTAAIVIYSLDFFSSVLDVSILFSILASLTYGFTSAFIPGNSKEINLKV